MDKTYYHQVKNVNDAIRFVYNSSIHDVHVVKDYDGTTTCQEGVTQTASNGGLNYTVEENTTYYFYCSILDHCSRGMHKTITVLPKGASYDDSNLGHYNDPYDQMAEKECQTGTYQDDIGEIKCKTSTTCESGKYVDNHLVSHKNAARVDRTCGTCAVGRYTSGTNLPQCTVCSSKIANDDRTGCKDDDDGTPDWVVPVAASAGGLAVLIFAVSVYLWKQKRRGYEKMEETRKSITAPIGNMFY